MSKDDWIKWVLLLLLFIVGWIGGYLFDAQPETTLKGCNEIATVMKSETNFVKGYGCFVTQGDNHFIFYQDGVSYLIGSDATK